MMHLTI